VRRTRAVIWSFGVAVVGGALAAGVFAIFLPGGNALILDLYLLYLGGITLLALVRMTRVAQPGSAASPFERALRANRGRAQRPPELVRLERQLALAATTVFDVHYRLRPVVREIASQRLWAKHAVDLENEPKRAESLLPAKTWELVRPDRPPPTDRFARGPGFPGIEAVVIELERS
jgi:hypothetical protein